MGKKRLVMIKTRADGTKVRKVISEDDPILKKVAITKAVKKSVPSCTAMVSSSSQEDSTEESDSRESVDSLKARGPPLDHIRKRLAELQDDKRQETETVNDNFKITVNPSPRSRSTHRTLAGKALELAVRDEKRTFQVGQRGEEPKKMFQTLASRAKAASYMTDEFEDEDWQPRRRSLDERYEDLDEDRMELIEDSKSKVFNRLGARERY